MAGHGYSHVLQINEMKPGSTVKGEKKREQDDSVKPHLCSQQSRKINDGIWTQSLMIKHLLRAEGTPAQTHRTGKPLTSSY